MSSSPAADLVPPAAAPPAREGRVLGLVAGLGCYLVWGLNPLYFRLLTAVPVADVLAHRIVWSMVLLGALALAQGGWSEVSRTLRNRRTLALLVLTTILIAANWLTYLWSVFTGRMLHASLGYYINPLLSAVLAIVALGERPRRAQAAALALAGAGVAVLAVARGGLPWIALVLASTFALYGYLRKVIAAGPLAGLLIETALLTPLAVAWLLRPGATLPGPRLTALLALAGPATALPLLLFAVAAKRLRLTTLGILQYLSPTLQLLIAVAVGEPFGRADALSFSLIWTALAVYGIDAVRAVRRTRQDQAARAA